MSTGHGGRLIWLIGQLRPYVALRTLRALRWMETPLYCAAAAAAAHTDSDDDDVSDKNLAR